MMIRAATTVEGQRREQRLFDELGLALDGFMLLNQKSDQPDFARHSLSDQIAAVLPEAKRNNAMAVVWMSFPLANQVMLHLVALGSGRAFVRSIETDRSPVSEAALALMARELLGTAYLFEPPASVPAEVKEVVRTVKQEIPAEPVPTLAAVPAPPTGAPWGIWLRTQMGYPIAGGADAIPVLHLGVAAERKMPFDIEASLGLDARYGVVARPQAAGAQFLFGGATLSLFRGFPAGVSVGPCAKATFGYASFRAAGGTVGFWVPSFLLGVQARRPDTTGANLAVTVAVSYLPMAAELVAADNQLLYRTPVFELTFGLEVGWTGL
jgi:hypothetical protein